MVRILCVTSRYFTWNGCSWPNEHIKTDGLQLKTMPQVNNLQYSFFMANESPAHLVEFLSQASSIQLQITAPVLSAALGSFPETLPRLFLEEIHPWMSFRAKLSTVKVCRRPGKGVRRVRFPTIALRGMPTYVPLVLRRLNSSKTAFSGFQAHSQPRVSVQDRF